MRLDRLEISGFKSFSDRAELAFDQGVTAIVGPNGCGKSNVADAITWVLGEQSAKSLRGERMEDVIFSGSDARKPGGAAEVKLRLSGLPQPPRPAPDSPAPIRDNLRPFQPTVGQPAAPDAAAVPMAQGFDGGPLARAGRANGMLDDFADAFTRDVEVTRRLYRSGDSEYLIDGHVCRLRDVHELLMDTGLGAKAYAIIEQGKIGLILSSRPADRRQLIEEAAGITKYRARRRAAELKLEAAQQNLTRVDDIVFEVEKQRGALKRQAAKARRYKRLREELRRWEKVLFARRYRELAAAIAGTRERLDAARQREAAASARVAECENDLARIRLELAGADERASTLREDAHVRELQAAARQQQLAFDRQQLAMLVERSGQVDEEIRDLEARREPARGAIEARRAAVGEAESARDAAAAALAAATEDHAAARRHVEALEADVDAGRDELYRNSNAIAAIHHAVQHASAQGERVAELLARLNVEQSDLARERHASDDEYAVAVEDRARTHAALDRMHAEHMAGEAHLAVLRSSLEASTRDLRFKEQELAGLEARVASLEEVAASRAEFGDAARMVLREANGRVGQQGAVADYLDVEPAWERAVEALLGEMLQYVLVDRHEQAAEGLSLVRSANAGRCGFVVFGGDVAEDAGDLTVVDGVRPLAAVARATGGHARVLVPLLRRAYVADSYAEAVAYAVRHDVPVATRDGDVVRGPRLVAGGTPAEARGILSTRREIRDLSARVAEDRQSLATAAAAVAALEAGIASATAATNALTLQRHQEEKALVAHDAQLARIAEARARHERRAAVIDLEARRAHEERDALERRQEEAAVSKASLQAEERSANERLAGLQADLTARREAVAAVVARVTDASGVHAGLVERVTAVIADVARLEDQARDLEDRIAARAAELRDNAARRLALVDAVQAILAAIDADARGLEALKGELVRADEAATERRSAADGQEVAIRAARTALDDERQQANELDVARAKAESDLTHLAQAAIDTLQQGLDDVLAEVEALEAAGEAEPDAAALAADEPDPDVDEGEGSVASVEEAVQVAPAPTGAMTAEDAIARLRDKIDRLGPVNILAIEQFDELETRHTFLTSQRKDLVESIAQTTEAIERIDETTTARFTEAFQAVQVNFQQTFSTLFGGGRAGLTLTDENDPLESGIDIVASPPGKRLQSVQLLSGGEKALTAIALMFAIFRYKPSPFCLLDEIDAPLDDANVGRFVDMLRGMMDRTQFILITHNRRTMEIANRLYGVTMEEPGVSKLISVNLH
jgi:chromosome segregation protein